MTQESWFRRIWGLITPELIYLAICYLIDIAQRDTGLFPWPEIILRAIWMLL